MARRRYSNTGQSALNAVGKQIELPGLRPQAIALSPNGELLVVSGKTNELLVIDPDKTLVRQRVAFPAEAQTEALGDPASANILKPDRGGQVSYTGLVFSPDGRRIYLSNVDGSIKVFHVQDDGVVLPSHTIPLPMANAPRRKSEIPSGLAISGMVHGCTYAESFESTVRDRCFHQQITRSFDVCRTLRRRTRRR
jgi:DNA-binding beta-propeller fold protein YncE